VTARAKFGSYGPGVVNAHITALNQPITVQPSARLKPAITDRYRERRPNAIRVASSRSSHPTRRNSASGAKRQERKKKAKQYPFGSRRQLSRSPSLQAGVYCFGNRDWDAMLRSFMANTKPIASRHPNEATSPKAETCTCQFLAALVPLAESIRTRKRVKLNIEFAR
jgi:hypothetical protein